MISNFDWHVILIIIKTKTKKNSTRNQERGKQRKPTPSKRTNPTDTTGRSLSMLDLWLSTHFPFLIRKCCYRYYLLSFYAFFFFFLFLHKLLYDFSCLDNFLTCRSTFRCRLISAVTCNTDLLSF